MKKRSFSIETANKKISLKKQKHFYLIYTWSEKAFKGSVVYQTLLSFHGGSLETMLTVPLIRFYINFWEIKWQGNSMIEKSSDREMKWQGNEMTGKLNDKEIKWQGKYKHHFSGKSWKQVYTKDFKSPN